MNDTYMRCCPRGESRTKRTQHISVLFLQLPVTVNVFQNKNKQTHLNHHTTWKGVNSSCSEANLISGWMDGRTDTVSLFLSNPPYATDLVYCIILSSLGFGLRTGYFFSPGKSYTCICQWQLIHLWDRFAHGWVSQKQSWRLETSLPFLRFYMWGQKGVQYHLLMPWISLRNVSRKPAQPLLWI